MVNDTAAFVCCWGVGNEFLLVNYYYQIFAGFYLFYLFICFYRRRLLLYSVKLVACETGLEKAWFGMQDLVNI